MGIPVPSLIRCDRVVTKCEYCGRKDGPDVAGNCNGCGHPKPSGQAIDVTTFNDAEPQYISVSEPGPYQ